VEELKELIRLVFLSLALSGLAMAQAGATSTLRVELLDETKYAIEGARVVIASPDGIELPVTDIGGGIYQLSGVKPGRYKIRIEATDFVPYTQESLVVSTGPDNTLRVTLRVRAADQHVFVTSALPRNAIPEFLGGVRVLRGEALDNLPDTEGALMAYLRLLAPRSVGPFGPAIFVDGFPAGYLPPKSSIREIRINDNPFSAEYSQVGLSRVEILTKPGTEIWQSSLFLYFNDESLNSRNSFAQTRAPFQNRMYGGNFGGPIIKDKLTLAMDVGRVERDDNTIINATTLDSAFNITPFNRTLIKPARELSGNTRINYQLSQKHTLATSYRVSDQRSSREGVGEFSLESRAYDSFTRTHTLQLTETAVLGDNAMNEMRLQLLKKRVRKAGDDSVPAIEIPQAFVAGGSDIGSATDRDESLFFNNHMTLSSGDHTFKAGVELRAARLTSRSSTNVAGTYIFTGRIAPQLDENNDPIFGPDGQVLLTSITNIESYRRTLVLQQKGLSPERIRVLGGGPSLFSIASGSAEAQVRQYETAGFFQDDWRARSNLSMKLGFRYETQNNIRGRINLAPRVSIAWEPFSGTVLRAGSGIFYDRVTEDLTMQATLLNGTARRQFLTVDADILESFPKKLSADSLTNLLISQTVWQLAPGVRTPYSVHSSFSFEQVLPLRSTFGLTLTHTRGLHSLRARNINAPLANQVRPLASQGEIFQFESSGLAEQRQLLLNTTHNISDNSVLWTTYTLSNAKSDTDGPFSFPGNSYDLRAEYGKAAANARHTFYTGGWFKIPGGVELTPLIMWRSGLPFNITTGRDNNGDSQFTERPAFATDLDKPSVVQTGFGAFDLQPEPGQAIIPRNFGVGPSFTIANLRISRYFRVGNSIIGANGSSTPNKRLLTLALQIQNLFNNANPGAPVGNLSSPLFGRSTAAAGDFGFGSNSAGTRRLDFSLVISF
jgi:hypothetical protein